MLTMGWMIKKPVPVLLALLPSLPPETVALILPLAGALLATFTVRLMGEENPPATRASDRVQLRLFSVQVQPSPLIAPAVSPVERFTITFTAPTDATLPALLINIGKLTLVCPWLTKPVPETLGVRSTRGVAICVRSLKELFALLVSPPPETVTVLTTLVGALAAMFTVRKIGA